MKHVEIFREEGRFAGWPANYGIWSWDNEIVLGFTVGYHVPDGGFHTRDKTKPFVTCHARSPDGGETWEVTETPVITPGGRALSADEHVNPDLQAATALERGEPGAPTPCPGTVDFTDPDFALMCGRTGLAAGARSWFYLSTNRCATWDGPYELPMFDTPGVAARTDYQVLGPKSLLLFLTAAKSNGKEGHVFCARTDDGGKSFQFVSWLGPEPSGYQIMPASVRLPSGRILVAVRCHEKQGDTVHGDNWIDMYASDDLGSTWEKLPRPVPYAGWGGNPPTLNRLEDGRLCLTYGFRDSPSGMRAIISEDDGQTWGPECILRDDGGNQDLGYPRTVVRPDGKLVTAYYYNDHPDGERYIAATIWKP